MRRSALWYRNYDWNLAELRKPGCIDPNYKGAIEDLAERYADADTTERVIRPTR